MLKFRCPNCAQKLKVQDDRAGRTARCPRCKERITIPSPSASEPAPLALEDELTLAPPEQPPMVAPEALLDLAPAPAPMARSERARLAAAHVSAAEQNDDDLLTSLGIEPQPRHTGQRQTMWLLDILLYPTSSSGWITLAIIVGLTLLVPFVGLFPFMDLVLAVIIFLYSGWYLAECVYDSATGGVRAPALPVAGLGEMWSRVSYFIAIYTLYLLPPVVYYLFTRQTDPIFYALSIWTVVFFPMGLVAMAVMDSTTALNPFVLLWAILRTIPSYVGLLILLAVVTLLTVLVWSVLANLIPSILGTLVAQAGAVYTSMVQAHVLGRFYWRNRERLDWGI
jgi:DNA-directed RNA polymerase subunit RPC12/RpoP